MQLLDAQQLEERRQQSGACFIAAEDLASAELVQDFDAAINYGTLQHCPISQGAAAVVHDSACRCGF